MSRRMIQVIDVLAELWARRHWIALARADAVTEAARRSTVGRTTVHTKLARELAPYIEKIEDFDLLAAQWLYCGSDELLKVLLACATDDKDRAAIKAFFAKPGWPEAAA